MGVIYLRPNLINGKKYVGQATDLEERQNRWKCLTQPYAGPAINAARAKYGIDNFGFEILKECEDEELDKWEKYYIKELNTKAPFGYNLTDGGGGKSGFTVSEETRKKMSEAQKGEKHHMYGKHLSEETRNKLSEAHRGKKITEEMRKKMSEAHKGEKNHMYGKHLSEETKRKLSESHKGKTTWMKGKHLSEETRKKMSEAHKGKDINGKCSKSVLQINKDTNEIITEFPSVSEVQRQLGYNQSNISNCCKGNRKTCCGFKWRYKDESAA